MRKLDTVFKQVERPGGVVLPWTYRDELMDLLDQLENYEMQHGNYSAPRELVRDIRRMVRKLG